jgi:hypothetical protein
MADFLTDFLGRAETAQVPSDSPTSTNGYPSLGGTNLLPMPPADTGTRK